jgi:hypothetical protein
MNWRIVTGTGLCLQLSCVIPYGPAQQVSELEAATSPAVTRWSSLDARLLQELSAESDRDRIQRLRLARELLASSKTLPPQAQREVLAYVEALLVIEERSSVGSVGAAIVPMDGLIEDEELGTTPAQNLSPSTLER